MAIRHLRTHTKPYTLFPKRPDHFRHLERSFRIPLRPRALAPRVERAAKRRIFIEKVNTARPALYSVRRPIKQLPSRCKDEQTDGFARSTPHGPIPNPVNGRIESQNRTAQHTIPLERCLPVANAVYRTSSS